MTAIEATLPASDNQTALAIAEFALAGEIALRRGRASEAVRQFRAATALEDGLVYAEPPTWYYPMRHSLGKALLAANRPREAELVYRRDLARFPNNGWSLYGLSRSLFLQGKITEGRKASQMFEEAWRAADVQTDCVEVLRTERAKCRLPNGQSSKGVINRFSFLCSIRQFASFHLLFCVHWSTDCRSSHVIPLYSLMLKTAVTGLLVTLWPLQAPPGLTERTTM